MTQTTNIPLHPSQQPGRSLPTFLTWRVRGVPAAFDRARLVEVLQQHPGLQHLDSETKHVNNTRSNVQVNTLAHDLGHHQVATIRFTHVPTRLRSLDHGEQLTIDITEDASGTCSAVRLAIDRHFHGITVLSCPPANTHTVDILAVPGLNAHAFGSFVHKDDGHMWLSDRLSCDMPNARVMIYGYDSHLEGSTSFAGIDDLAGSLSLDVGPLFRHGLGEQKRLVFIGHSLGGLLIKGALIRMAEAKADWMTQIVGAVFFGVPNRGMDGLESLIPMVTDQPNRAMVESLSRINSDFLSRQEVRFDAMLKEVALEMFCFYETELSPTAAKDRDGQWKMIGELKALVSVSSATGCLPPSKLSSHSAALPRTHSNLVKFAWHHPDYSRVIGVLQAMEKQEHRFPPSVIAAPPPPINANWELIEGAQNGNLQQARLSLHRGADINTRDSNKRTPLHLAVLAGHERVVELLLQKGANVNARDEWLEPPLRHAVMRGWTGIAGLLIQHGADVRAKDKWNETPLWLARRPERAESNPGMARLLERAASVRR
ncbi:hypothetical protein QBC34DRAFT_42923 [Podospora aff. communis PSN243]|uniref:DUF676 domain-containing protein n=1 Tax=Podospora aff. communis PSN243 TaxID=3040156 RepID=A0AAV9FZP3_9PEZI|nr:hypothetical protein QBC34DRAFT_42923 [Podospora aff. communis PSN243]